MKRRHSVIGTGIDFIRVAIFAKLALFHFKFGISSAKSPVDFSDLSLAANPESRLNLSHFNFSSFIVVNQGFN